ncbi:alpha/beta hydrolase, partial [Rhodococcus jostii]
MNGHKWVGFATVLDANDDPVRVGPPGWHVVGVGHFGGSGDDILWHDIDGTKELQIWLMDRHRWVGVENVVNDQDQPVSVGPPGWHVKGVRGTMHHLPAPCVQTGIIHTDYRLNFKIPPGLMPDRQFDSVHASLRVHRVSPTYANSDCKPARAIVLVHGRTLGGSTSFDLQHTTAATGPLSLQEALANAGIDTFAPDLLGYALSTRLSLDDPKNASRPECTSTGDPTIDQCDRSRNKFIFPLDQQKRLQPNPLGTSYANHSSATYFGTTALWARDIRQVVNDALTKTGLPTVSLLGYSFGGPRVGRTLQQLGITAADRIDRLIFMASLFDTLPPSSEYPTGHVDYPTDEADLKPFETSTSFPLVLNTVGWDNPSADRIPPGADKALAKQAQLLDAVGAKWGGSATTPAGFVRSPTFTVSGWNKDVAAAITIPTLVLHGTEDRSVLPANAPHLYDALTTEQKVLIELDCASHFLHYETAPTWEGPHKAVADAIIEWVRSATFTGKTTGQFTIDCDGNVNPP